MKAAWMIAYTVLFTEWIDSEKLVAQWAAEEDRVAGAAKLTSERQREYLTGRATLRALLHHVTQKNDWYIAPDAKGKPRVFAPDGAAGPHISLTHTHGMVACAVSEAGPVGIDAEFHRPRDFVALAGYAFGLSEQAAVRRDGADAFYRIWTLKEAAAKLNGEGIFTMLGGADDFAAAPANAMWKDKGRCFLSSCPAPDYHLAIVAEGEPSFDRVLFG